MPWPSWSGHYKDVAILRIRWGPVSSPRARRSKPLPCAQRRHRVGLHTGGGAAFRPAYVSAAAAFNIRCGIGPELEKPSKRYGSVPVDGPAAGIAIEPHWDHMLDVWQTVRYDRKPTAKADLLRELGLEHVIPSCGGEVPSRAV